MAQRVVEAEIFPDPDLSPSRRPLFGSMRATVVREVAKHTMELSQLIVGNGGVGTLIDYIMNRVATLGCQSCEALATSPRSARRLRCRSSPEKRLVPLQPLLTEEPEHHKYTAEHRSTGRCMTGPRQGSGRHGRYPF
jgi:hypothetical protein